MNLKKSVLIITAVFIFSGAAYVASDRFFEVAKGIDLFTRIYKEMAFNYVDEINPQEFMRAGIRGMLSTVDPYTVFIDEKKQEDIDLLTNGKYGGIGVSIGVRDSKVTIMEIVDGHSAQKQGLQVGDVILKVDKTEVNEKNYEDVSSLVKGEPGTFVKLFIQRNGLSDTLMYELLREEIKIKSVAFAGFYPENSSVAYLKLTQFSRPSADEIKNAILELKKIKPITGIIFDVRNNPGGLLDVAVDISNRFLPKGNLIVSTKGRDSSSLRQYYANQEPLLKDVPLVLLVNEGSASASEILAGAIQDHDRGVVLGQKTFGKGLVQTITPLSYNTSLKITTSKYYTPSGRCIQKINYSKDNKVISRSDSAVNSRFLTEKKREVFSLGGITPDTLVQDETEPGIVRDMLAKGIFFKFANKLQAENTKEQLASLKDDFIIEKLKVFLNSEKYAYTSELAKKVDELADLAKKDKQFSHLHQKFIDLSSQINKTSSFDVEDCRNEILEEVRVELSQRLFGSEGRIKESLKYDNQFQTAVHLLSVPAKYQLLLSGK